MSTDSGPPEGTSTTRARSSTAALLAAAAAVLVAAIAVGTWARPADTHTAAAEVGGIAIKGATPPPSRPDTFALLRFYVHEVALLPNATTFFVVPPVAGLPADLAGADLFGGVVVHDDVVTAGPERESQEVGRARGFYVLDSQDARNPSLEVVFTVALNAACGFPGSTIQYRGFNLIPMPVREISIAGGTGAFRLARGWAEYTVVSNNGFVAVFNFTSYVFYGGSGRFAK